jgi:hypothetical protein
MARLTNASAPELQTQRCSASARIGPIARTWASTIVGLCQGAGSSPPTSLDTRRLSRSPPSPVSARRQRSKNQPDATLAVPAATTCASGLAETVGSAAPSARSSGIRCDSSSKSSSALQPRTEPSLADTARTWLPFERVSRLDCSSATLPRRTGEEAARRRAPAISRRAPSSPPPDTINTVRSGLTYARQSPRSPSPRLLPIWRPQSSSRNGSPAARSASCQPASGSPRATAAK